jgi:hypothetical protein
MDWFPDVRDPCGLGEAAYLVQVLPAAGLGDLKVTGTLATQFDGGAATLRVDRVALPVRQACALGGAFEQQVDAMDS